MKTPELIDLLARGAGPVVVTPVGPRLLPPAAVGLALSAALAVLFLGLIPTAMWSTPAPWFKAAYALGLALGAGWLTARLARPVASTAGPLRVVTLVALAMGLLGAVNLLSAPSGQRWAVLLGHSWWDCPLFVLGLSLPALVLTLGVVRRLAPTRLRSAGAAAGLMAGAVGALGYALACVEVAPAFVAIWYSAGIGLTAALGAALGPRALRW